MIAVMDRAIRLSKRPSETRCPYCHGDLLEGEPVESCGGCGAVHHRRCFRDPASCACCARPTGVVPLARLERPRRNFVRELHGLAARNALTLAVFGTLGFMVLTLVVEDPIKAFVIAVFAALVVGLAAAAGIVAFQVADALVRRVGARRRSG
jgi:hypothetical protein